MNNKRVFASNLKYYLSRIGKTPADLISDLNFKSSTVYSWTNGDSFPRMGKLEDIAAYLNIPVSTLITPRDENDSQKLEDIDTNNLNFGERLKFLRSQTNETQNDIAKLLNVTQASVNGYENKNRQPDQHNLIKLANHFHVSTDYLLTGENKKNFSQEQLDTFKKEALKEDTRNMAAHSTNKDLSARGIDPKAVAQVMDEYLSTPEGQKHLSDVLGFEGFEIDDDDLD